MVGNDVLDSDAIDVRLWSFGLPNLLHGPEIPIFAHLSHASSLWLVALARCLVGHVVEHLSAHVHRTLHDLKP